MGKEIILDPWKVEGAVDYKRLINDFGISEIRELPALFENELLFRRKVVFAHRDMQRIFEAMKKKKKFVMMTGLMPTGKFHIGHLILAKQMIFYQNLGAKLYIAIADLEAYHARGQSLEKSRKIAIEEYIKNYIALGLNEKNCEIYFQSDRNKDGEKAGAYYSLASNFARYVTFNEFKGVYGDISPGKMVASLIQAADMYHPQLKEFEGNVPVFIPVGIDQDSHIRIARGMAKRNKDHKFIPISSTYHLFVPGLKSGKMSSSDEMSFIALTDTPKDVERKIKKYAFSGGKDTVEEHRKHGGNPDIDVSFQYLKMFFEPDDDKLSNIEKEYRSGNLLTGELKELLIKNINVFLKDHQVKRKKAGKIVRKFIKE